MASHSSTLARKIPWAEEPGRLQSMGSLRVRHNWVTSLSLFTVMHWRRKWQPTPVFLPGESQGRGSLVGCHLWGHTESDTTEAMQQQQQCLCWVFWFAARLFLSRSEQGLLSDCDVQASHYGSFSCRTQALGFTGFGSWGVWVPSLGSQVPQHRLNSCAAQV